MRSFPCQSWERSRRFPGQPCGAIAQLGERLHGMQEVVGSIPTSSTIYPSQNIRQSLKTRVTAGFLLGFYPGMDKAVRWHPLVTAGNFAGNRVATEESYQQMALTDAAVRNARPPEKPQKLADGKGLYLLLAPSGGKWWRFDYRSGRTPTTLPLGA